MANKEKIDYLLSDIRELERIVVEMSDAEVYPVSFFSRTFDLTHKILNDLHILEGDQIETLKKQMEEHQRLIQSIPLSKAAPHPVIPAIDENEITPVKEIAEEQTVESILPSADKHIVSLYEIQETKNLLDFRKAFSLNDRFYFRRELFGNDEAKMSKVISDLNEIHSYEESMVYLNEKLNWNTEDNIVAEFIKLLEKRFI